MSPITFRRKMIRTDKTLGEQFQAARSNQKLSIDEAERATHIRGKYLLALEEGQFDVLPESVYTLGFVRRYAQFLALDPNQAIAQHRAERITSARHGQTKHLPTVEPALRITSNVREARWVITPKLFWVSSSLAVVVAIAGYMWWQVQGFMAAPDLEVAQPQAEMVVSTPTIEIKGQTDGTASVTINAEPVTLDPEGYFQQEVRLTQGVNTIEVAAKNRLNKETRKQIRVLATY